MTDVPAWIAAGIGLAALVVAYLAYRSQRGITRIEYSAITNRKLLPGRVARHLEVRHEGNELPEPSLAIVRLVNTGDKPLKAADYESHLVVTFDGVVEIASAIWTGSRPADLRPEIQIDGNCVCIEPSLINPEDMLELQVISAGKADNVSVAGRIADLTVVPRPGLPYPPGSGREGEMVGFDKFMWYLAGPAIIIVVGVAASSSPRVSSTTAEVLVLVATGIIAGVLYPLHVSYLVRRRRLWRS